MPLKSGEFMEYFVGGGRNVLKSTLSLTRRAQQVGGRAVEAFKDAVSDDHHLEKITDADEQRQLAEADGIRQVAARVRDMELFDVQTLHIATIYARSLCRHIERSRYESIAFSLVNLRDNLQLLGTPHDISGLNLSPEQVDLINPYLQLPEIPEK